jgi:hypothetical protein
MDAGKHFLKLDVIYLHVVRFLDITYIHIYSCCLFYGLHLHCCHSAPGCVVQNTS